MSFTIPKITKRQYAEGAVIPDLSQKPEATTSNNVIPSNEPNKPEEKIEIPAPSQPIQERKVEPEKAPPKPTIKRSETTEVNPYQNPISMETYEEPVYEPPRLEPQVQETIQEVPSETNNPKSSDSYSGVTFNISGQNAQIHINQGQGVEPQIKEQETSNSVQEKDIIQQILNTESLSSLQELVEYLEYGIHVANAQKVILEAKAGVANKARRGR